MGTPRETIWDIEPHTIAKHKTLENYLQAWFPILNKYNGRIIYLDGFCGPGRYSKGERGSPIIALETALNHRRRMTGELVFVFVDERKDRVENLKQEISRFALPGHFKVLIDVGNFEEVLDHTLNKLERSGKNLPPTFAFIDPFGFSGLPFHLVSRLLTYPKCEVLITFMVSSINRFLGVTGGDAQKHIVKLFGTDEVLAILHCEGDRIALLRELYQRQLETPATFVRFFEMCDKNGQTIYYLFFGSNNDLGHLKMKEAMWRVDAEGDYRFSDKTNPSQVVLFHEEHGPRLFNLLKDRYGLSARPVSDIRRYVCDETPYLTKHMKASLDYAEHERLISVAESKLTGKKRKKGTFPDDAVVTFL